MMSEEVKDIPIIKEGTADFLSKFLESYDSDLKKDESIREMVQNLIDKQDDDDANKISESEIEKIKSALEKFFVFGELSKEIKDIIVYQDISQLTELLKQVQELVDGEKITDAHKNQLFDEIKAKGDEMIGHSLSRPDYDDEIGWAENQLELIDEYVKQGILDEDSVEGLSNRVKASIYSKLSRLIGAIRVDQDISQLTEFLKQTKELADGEKIGDEHKTWLSNEIKTKGDEMIGYSLSHPDYDDEIGWAENQLELIDEYVKQGILDEDSVEGLSNRVKASIYSKLSRLIGAIGVDQDISQLTELLKQVQELAEGEKIGDEHKTWLSNEIKTKGDEIKTFVIGHRGSAEKQKTETDHSDLMTKLEAL